MFFRIVCSSFRRFKCVMQKMGGQNIAGILSDKKSETFVKPSKIAQKFANTEKKS